MSVSIEQLLAATTDGRSAARHRVRAARAVLEALRPDPPRTPRKPLAHTRSPAELQAMLAELLRAERESLERGRAQASTRSWAGNRGG